MALAGGERAPKLASKWVKGLWLGVTDESGEHLVYAFGKVDRYRTIRRLAADRWNGPALKALRATPREPKSDNQDLSLIHI